MIVPFKNIKCSFSIESDENKNLRACAKRVIQPCNPLASAEPPLPKCVALFSGIITEMDQCHFYRSLLKISMQNQQTYEPTPSLGTRENIGLTYLTNVQHLHCH